MLKLLISSVILRFSLRSKCYRSPIHLQNIAFQEGLTVDSALDLGSGPNPKNPFGANSVYGLDIRSFDINPIVSKCTLGIDCFPFDDNFFEAVTAYDVLEHIPRVRIDRGSVGFPFIFLMNEIWRVFKVGGVFYSETPCFPMKEAFQDPTHVNIMTEDTMSLYFCEKRWAKIYGFSGSFTVIKEGWLRNKYFCLLRKTSDVIAYNVNEPQD